MNQLILPMDLEVLIPPNHLSTIVNEAVEQLNDSLFLSEYKGGGRPAFHPKLLLKIIVYAYTQKIYSGRQMAKQLTENIYFMWLSNQQTPDFRTINRFRSEKMKELIYEVFFSIIDLLKDKGLVKLENYFLDGTKIEANANQYTFVWRKSAERYENGVDDKYTQLVSQIEHVISEEEACAPSNGLEEKLSENPITSEQIAKTVTKLEDRLKKEPKNNLVKKAVRVLKKDILPRKVKYENYRILLNGRNSFSKTDIDATFMRMKEDHMRNGQLKAAYNVQIGTENQFITGFSLHQRPGDSRCLIDHMEVLKKFTKIPPKVIADAGYGSEENYTYLEKEETMAFVKYNTFDQEQKRSWKEKIEKAENMEYDEELDEFICANGQRLIFQSESKRKSPYGHVSQIRNYTCFECKGCPFQTKCAKDKDSKTIALSMNNQKQRKEITQRLLSEDGKRLYAQRKCDVECVFAQIKHNKKMRRFSLRGLPKNTADWGLICIAHNCRKWQTAINRINKKKKESPQ